jgi:hypothetical protein
VHLYEPHVSKSSKRPYIFVSILRLLPPLIDTTVPEDAGIEPELMTAVKRPYFDTLFS